MKNKILESIEFIISQNIAVDSDSGEIAFYGLTSKSELQYRDKIAFNLYRKYNDKYNVIREWKKCDLAVLEKNSDKPIALIEFKVCYSCDLYKPSTIKEYTIAIKSDFEKSKKLSDKETEVYSILFIVKPKEKIPDELKEVVKYRTSINAGFNKLGDAENIEMIGEANLRSEFKNIEFKEIRNEKAFGIQCGLGYCVIKNES